MDDLHEENKRAFIVRRSSTTRPNHNHPASEFRATSLTSERGFHHEKAPSFHLCMLATEAAGKRSKVVLVRQTSLPLAALPIPENDCGFSD